MRSVLSSLFVLLAASATVISTPVKRDGDASGGLTVSLKTSSPSVSDADGLSIIATVANGRSADVRLRKYGSVLDDELPTQSFTITSEAGDEVPFQGSRLVLSNDLPDEAYVIIPAGGSVTATHSNLNQIYDFSGSGPGTYEFTVAQPGDTDFKSQSSASVKVEITGETAKRDRNYERAYLECSTPTYANQINASYTEALYLAALAYDYITTYGAEDVLFRGYFGAQQTTVPLAVLSRAYNGNTNRRFYCSDPHGGCTSGVIAYTWLATRDVYYCSPFYSQVSITRLCTDTSVSDRKTRGGSTLIQLVFATSDTDDTVYGCDDDIALAQTNPAAAAANADNYLCFATSVFAVADC